jgi:HEAT repeat protein
MSSIDRSESEMKSPPEEPGESSSARYVRQWQKRAREVALRIERGELEAMIAQLMDEDEHRSYEVALDIVKGGQAVIPRVIELADDPRPRMREMACYILGQLGDPDAEASGSFVYTPEGVPTLVRLLETDSDEEVRAGAASALGFQKVPASLPALCVAALHPSAEVRYAVAQALGSFYEEGWDDPEAAPHRAEVMHALLRLMDDEDEDVRDWATFGIHQGGHDTPEVRARLWKALDDPHADVRGEAACGLAKFGDRSLIPRLEVLLREDPLVTTHFFEAAEELGDPCLLPAVLAGAERWRAEMKAGEKMHLDVTSAIEALQAADSPAGDEEMADGEGN